MYYINKGKIKVYKIHDFGKELITSLLKDGDFFGYTSLLEEKDYTENAQALEDVEITFIPREEFFNLVYNNQAVAKKFLHILTKSVTVSREDLANIVGTATESLIRTLSDFKDEKLVEIKEGKIFLVNEKKLKELKN